MWKWGQKPLLFLLHEHNLEFFLFEKVLDSFLLIFLFAHPIQQVLIFIKLPLIRFNRSNFLIEIHIFRYIHTIPKVGFPFSLKHCWTQVASHYILRKVLEWRCVFSLWILIHFHVHFIDNLRSKLILCFIETTIKFIHNLSRSIFFNIKLVWCIVKVVICVICLPDLFFLVAYINLFIISTIFHEFILFDIQSWR